VPIRRRAGSTPSSSRRKEEEVERNGGISKSGGVVKTMGISSGIFTRKKRKNHGGQRESGIEERGKQSQI